MNLHSKIIGQGEPFLILHGFLGSGDNWKTLGKEFSSWGYEVHLIDQRNHGRSPHSVDFSYEVMAQDILEYVEHHSLNDCILLGHSMGGKTAMAVATSYPDVVSRLIVADIGPKFYPQHHQTILNGLQALDFTKITSRGEADEALAQYIKVPAVRMFLLKNLYWKTKTELGLRMNLAVLTKEIEQIGKALPEEKCYNGATLFIKGENSDYIQEEDVPTIKRHFPNSKVASIPKAGHWLHAENPKMFTQITSEFLRS